MKWHPETKHGGAGPCLDSRHPAEVDKYNGGQSTSGVNFCYEKLDMHEKKAMRENHTNVGSNLYLR